MKKIILLMLSVFLAACEKPTEPLPPPRPALVMVVGKAALDKSMVLVGEVKARFESNQGFRIKGKIIERKVDVGSIVKKGQVLARLDATDLNLNAEAANADVSAAQANYDLAKADVERQRQLVNKQFVSPSTLDKFEANLKTAGARVQQAKAQAAASANQSRYTNLVADRDGVVTQIHAEPGQVVDVGEMVAQVADTKQIEVLVSVPESRMSALKVGDKVSLKLWASQEKTYEGRVREIAPVASSATRAFDVRVAFAAADDAVKLGMTVGVKFDDSESYDLEVPITALTEINGKPAVWVIDKNGVANPRAVTTGQFTEDGVPITSGLQEGEMVAIAGVHTLVKGQKVQPKVEKAQ